MKTPIYEETGNRAEHVAAQQSANDDIFRFFACFSSNSLHSTSNSNLHDADAARSVADCTARRQEAANMVF